MPHDAALYADSVKQRSTPAETSDANAAEVAAAQAEYADSALSAASQYRERAGVPDPVPPEEPRIPEDPQPTWTKAEIVVWLLANGVALSESALENLNKSELLSLVEAVLSPV